MNAGNIIKLEPRQIIEITSGKVTGAYIEDSSGTREVTEDVGKTLFFVDVIETDGTRLGMWSGESWPQAQLEAEECRRDFGGLIRDRTGAAA